MANYNAKDVPDNLVVPDDIYRLRIEEQVENGGTDQDPRPLSIDVTFTIEEPTNWKGFYVRKRFWLGTKEDPKCEEPITRRSRDWVSYKSYLKACDVTPTGNTEEEAEMVKGGEVLGQVGTRKYRKKTDAEGERSGLDNTVYRFFKPGTKEVGTASHAQTATASIPTTGGKVYRAAELDE